MGPHGWRTVKAMSSRFLAPPEWYASLPTVHVSACALLTDSEDRVLLVKPNYRPYWPCLVGSSTRARVRTSAQRVRSRKN